MSLDVEVKPRGSSLLLSSSSSSSSSLWPSWHIINNLRVSVVSLHCWTVSFIHSFVNNLLVYCFRLGARQIGDIAKSHPQDLSSLLRKVLHYLRSKKWDTRVAAAHAIGAIVLNVKHISLSELLNSLGTKLGEAGLSGNVDEVVASGNLQSKLQANAPFRSFEMNKVLEFGALLASGGQD
ncbi:hypothetical protein Bca4012_031706 [Brassica carinata]